MRREVGEKDRKGREKGKEEGSRGICAKIFVSSPCHVHTVRLDSTGQREVTVNIAGSNPKEVLIEIEQVTL